MRPLRFAPFWLSVGFTLVGLVVYASLTPHPQKLPVHFWDKAEHASAYLVLALCFACIYMRDRFIRIGLLLLAMGVALEFIQAHVGRDCQFTDMLADAAGILPGLLLGLTPLGKTFARVEAWLGLAT